MIGPKKSISIININNSNTIQNSQINVKLNMGSLIQYNVDPNVLKRI